MKMKKILGGLVVVAVLLSGTTVLYFAGVDRAGLTPALAVPDGEPVILPSGDCADAGGFCADNLGTGGGCNPRACCPQGQTYCWQGSHRDTRPFQQLGSPPPPSLGSCWKYDGSTAPWCDIDWCDGGPEICTALCEPAGTGGTVYHSKPVSLNAGCLPVW